ncbi:MAG: FapA family protein, partial [Negativicutes bacterium]|nr:FapA family protein [Negativicutes bacterium]
VGWVRIEGLRYRNQQDIEIFVSQDGMSAYIQYATGSGASLDDAWRRVEKSGVVHGIDRKAVERAYFRIGLRQKFASGDYPQPGPDAYLKYWVDRDSLHSHERVEEGLPVNSILPLVEVKAGQTIVERVPCELGPEGKDVLGMAVPAVSGRDIAIPAGQNVEVKGDLAVATCDGMAQFFNGKLRVVPLLVIEGDIEATDGTIEFDGNVVVQGSLLNGARLTVTGHAEICGGVLGGELVAENVNIHQGIQKRVKVRRVLTANFAENAVIHSGDSVYIKDIVYHSQVTARRRVFVVGGKGVIVGGRVSAGEEVRCRVAGADVGVSTEIHVGVDPKLREEALMLRSEIKQLEINLQQVQAGLDKLKTMAQTGRLSEESRAMQLQLTKTQFRLQSQLEQYQQRLGELSEQFSVLHVSAINIRDRAYAGVRVSVGRRSKLITRDMRFVRFIETDDGLAITPYKE